MSDDQSNLFGADEDLGIGAATQSFDQIPNSATIPIAPNTYENLDQLKAHCLQCQRCDLASGRTNVVVSRGNPGASILLIGEGPGQQEDEQGQPFVGKSGQLLDKIFDSVGIDTNQDVYICNIVKCRPPGNRAPTTMEAAACKGYLLEQIRLVDPKIILLTGNTALKGILNEQKGITKVRGQWMTWEGRHCMAIFHPAYLLRNQSREKGGPKWLMWQDIQAIKQKLEELT
jgi:uracil-DNA glycosylase